MLPFNQANQQQNLQAIYFNAVQAHNAGDLDSARSSYELILESAPNQVDTNYQMGRLLVQQGAAQEALRYFEKAAQLSPATFDLWRTLIDTLAGVGMRKQAKKTLRRAGANGFALAEMNVLRELAERDPSNSVTPIGDASKADVDRVVFFLESGNIAGAEKQALQLATDNPTVAFMQNLLGVVLMQKGETRDAAECFALAAELDPFFPDAFSNLGKAYVDLGGYEEAVEALQSALKLAPDMYAANVNLGSALVKLGRGKEAVLSFKKALKFQPASIEAKLGLAEAHKMAKEGERALEIYQDVLASSKVDHDIRVAQAGVFDCLGDLDRDEDTIVFLQGLLEKEPNSSVLNNRLGMILSRVGEFDKAKDALRLSLEFDETEMSAFSQYGRVTKWQKDDPLIDRAVALFEQKKAEDSDRIDLGFALAKAMEDTKQSGRVFRFLDDANAETRKLFYYSTDKTRSEFQGMAKAYTREFFDDLAQYANPDVTPIFVLGMPRSGTTLTEQIISNHRDVTGGGELGDILHAVRVFLENSDRGLIPQNEVDLKKLGTNVERTIVSFKDRFPGSPRITDKNTHTFVFLGFVFALLPNAKVVHISRNPVDNCYSVYKNRFVAKSHRYSNNQTELAEYYCMYDDLMQHWRDLFPGKMIDVDYDQLVADPDTNIRALIDGLGLDWDEACLTPQSNKRVVKTLSIYQVRQAITKASSQGWKKYESDLTDVTDVLSKHPRLSGLI